MKKLFFALWLLFIVFTVSAQKSSEKTGALLWKISGNGLAQPSYIFGTHHAYPLSFLDSIPGVKTTFESCGQMVGELQLSDMTALVMELQKAGTMPQDTTYQMLLTEEDYLFVDKQLTSLLGAGLQVLGRLKPSMLTMTYTAILFQKMFPQMKPGEAMDMWFQQEARNKQLPVIGLETVQDQIDAVINFSSLKRQSQDLVCGLKNTGYMEEQAKKLNQLYRMANLAQIATLLDSEDKGPCPWSEAEEAALNKNRNERWLKKLPELMAAKSCFVAVGCMHLAGDVGLLSGLERMGYTVEAVQK